MPDGTVEPVESNGTNVSSYVRSALPGALREIGAHLRGYGAYFLEKAEFLPEALCPERPAVGETKSSSSACSTRRRRGKKLYDQSTTDQGGESDGYATEAESPLAPTEEPDDVSGMPTERLATADALSLIFHDFVQFDFRAESREMNLAHAVVTFRFCERIHTTQSVPHCVLVMCAIRLLVVRGYPFEDIVSTLGLALANLELLEGTLSRMGVQERTMVSICQLYLVHSFLEDEYLPLVAWHRYLFSSYCSFTTLRHAVLKLWKLRNFRIVVPREVSLARSRELLAPMEVVDMPS